MSRRGISPEEARLRARRLLTVGEELPKKLRKSILECGAAAAEPLLEILQDVSLLPRDASGGGFAPAHALDILVKLGDMRVVPLVIAALGNSNADLLHLRILDSARDLGEALVEPLLGAFAALPAGADEDDRELLLLVLVRTGRRDERIYQLLLGSLARRSRGVVPLLEEYGDARAVGPLLEWFDELAHGPIRNRTANDRLFDIENAVVELGGELGQLRDDVVDRLYDAGFEDFQETWPERGRDRLASDLRGPVSMPPKEPVTPDEAERRVQALLTEPDLSLSSEIMFSILSCGEDALGALIRIVEDPTLAGEAAPNQGYGPILAAQVLRHMRDVRAVRPLLRALRHGDASLRSELILHLRVFGAAVDEPAVEELEHPLDRHHRAALLDVLRSVGARSDRILAVLLSSLRGDIAAGARLLASYGDVRAISPLVEQMNALLESTDSDPETAEALEPVLRAVLSLGGVVTEEQHERIIGVLGADDEDEDEEDWVPAAPIETPKTPVQRATPKIGRNEPCSCGSGRKYKKCHGNGAGPAVDDPNAAKA